MGCRAAHQNPHVTLTVLRQPINRPILRTLTVNFGTKAAQIMSAQEFQKRCVASGEAKVFKRIVLTLSFVAVLGAAGFCLTDKAEARRWRWDRLYVSYSYGPRAYYGHDVPYPTYYRGYYAPGPYYYSDY